MPRTGGARTAPRRRDAREHDRHERDERVQLAPIGRHSRADDHEIARHRDRHAGFLDQDQPGDCQEPGRDGFYQRSGVLASRSGSSSDWSVSASSLGRWRTRLATITTAIATGTTTARVPTVELA